MIDGESFDIRQVEDKVFAWHAERVPFQEADAVRKLSYIQKIRKDTEEPNPTLANLEAALLSLLAKARFDRLDKEDELAAKWIKEALEINVHDELANKTLIKMNLSSLSERLLPLVFPQIRETDHGNTKKKLAMDYLNIANAFFSKCPLYIEKLDEALVAANRMDDQALIENITDLQNVITKIKKPLMAIVKATEAYSDSLKGIFYSQSQLQEIKHSIQEIERLQKRWDELMPNWTNVQEEEENKALQELDEMIGLSTVKERVHRLYHYLHYQKARKESGFVLKDEISLNMILTGNPGTGKTTLARLLAKIYHELGLLERPEVLEVDRSHLVGGYVGQTEENTMNMIKKAVGGILFIDEAYSLKREGSAGNDYGQTAIDTIVSAMTNGELAGKFAVILAGYPEEMRQFLWSNPGLRSRFPESNHIHLPDYSTNELMNIAEKVALDNDYTFSDTALIELRKRVEKEQVDETFGNARTVKNIVLDSIFKKGASISLQNDLQMADFTVLHQEDVSVIEENDQKLSGIEKLEQLVGLDDVKKEVKSLISFVKVQQMRRDQQLPAVPIQLHSVFSGNPGTGKSTVAQIYAQILKELGLLKRGHLITAGRSDIVAGYLGQTAIKTKKKIREALGGVLFIDEAYSLVAGGPQDFGKEAIDTLVEEMTKHNENVVVILAGYPNEMEVLLESNPGLRSRFKKYFHFADYSAEEIVAIIERYAENYGYFLDPEATSYLIETLYERTFRSNGRYATDLVDKAIQNHSYRILNNEQEDLSEALSLLKKIDFEPILI
ncbi:AAA family ATPase [Anaerobacillus sp. MEB173]|uniref:AAA family ATPase n=1 Tax=Anaerobacillus sp. MEB173 TaxID=3383345 RepID=UPI003F8E5F6F